MSRKVVTKPACGSALGLCGLQLEQRFHHLLCRGLRHLFIHSWLQYRRPTAHSSFGSSRMAHRPQQPRSSTRRRASARRRVPPAVLPDQGDGAARPCAHGIKNEVPQQHHRPGSGGPLGEEGSRWNRDLSGSPEDAHPITFGDGVGGRLRRRWSRCRQAARAPMRVLVYINSAQRRPRVLRTLGRVSLPEGLVCFVKADCPTCQLVQPVLRQLAAVDAPLTVYTQDDPTFPAGTAPVDDTLLEVSYGQRIEIVPTLLRVEGGKPVERLEGWDRREWERLTGIDGLGDGLPAFRPGCGSRTLDIGMPEMLAMRYDGSRIRSRRIELGAQEDEVEATFARGWSDGLPLVPPTPPRVLRMLEGTSRDPQDVVAVVPPDLVECTVEKVAVNAVMAGCRPEYLPVVLAAVEAACTEAFNIHGILATTWFSGPM